MPPQILGKCNERAGILLAAEKASGSNPHGTTNQYLAQLDIWFY